METILVNGTGLVLMVAIIWWFWLSDTNSDPKREDVSHHH